ncbi:MAG TPA: LemA family protein [Pyrinomonadaceae bacterium]|jgi:LemA protein|nr:LemA family protein [Pyrinomonadaceae bacterium]
MDKKPIIILAVILGVVLLFVVILAASGIGSYNTLVTQQQKVNAQWAQVENQMQRRADLIPNIVATVKGIAGLEERVFTRIAEARSQLLSTMQNPNSTTEDKIAADAKFNQALRDGGLLGTGGRFLSITENYPQLKSNESFLKLQDELAGTENRLATARNDYNIAAQDYNTTRNHFPTVLVAGMMGFKEQPYFKADEGARQAPQVNFNQ